jgi:gliding motility-associated-like protein
MRKFLLLSIAFIISIAGFSQDFSNKGKDFWVGYGYHVSMGANGVNTGGAYQMVLYIATDSATTVTVSCPGNGYTATYNIPANTIFQTAALPKSGGQDCRLYSEGIVNRGIHIVATKPVVAYTHIYDNNVSGATLLFPTNTLGKEYYSINFEQRSNVNNSNCFFYVIACDTGTTTIEITPTANTIGGWVANTTYTVNLTQGQIYNVMGTLSGTNGVDLTGSKIVSIASGTGNCKKIAVFSGSGKLSIKCPNTGTGASSDNYMAQAFPKTAWGKQFLTVPTSQFTNNFFRVCVSDPTTVVKVNGIIQGGLTGNFYYQIQNTTPNLIEADKPITVAQYIASQGQCGGAATFGDPEMIYLSPVEQNISKVILNSTSNFNISSHYINVVLPNTGTAISSFRIDGAIPASAFTVHPQNSSYVYLQQNVSPGQHTVLSDSGFNITAYGYGTTESYGYNGGTNIKDLFTFITPINPLSISTEVTACTGTPFYFSLTLPKHPDSLTSLIWDYHGFFGTHNDTLFAPLTSDSSYLIGATQVWRYKLNHPHTFGPSGVYPITITAGTVTSEGCGNSVIIDRDLYVYDPPVLNFRAVNNGCVTDSVVFIDNTTYPTGTFSYKWYWDFGDGNFSTVKSPKHLYNAPGTYVVRYSVVSNVGCLSDTVTSMVFVTDVPTAKFGLSNPICTGVPVTFSDTSSASLPGVLTKWHWDFGDGFATTRTSNSDTTHIYNTWSPSITDTLTVETNSGCKSLPFYRTFKVNPKPVSNFTLPGGICLPADSARFISTGTIADGTSGFSYLWNFGDPPSAPNNTSALPNPAHYYNNAGPFSINLITTSAAGCIHDTTKILSNVYPQAIANFLVNTENCLNTATVFTDNSNGSGNAVTLWFWDFGDGSPINTLQNPTHTYAVAGIKTIKHWIKTNVGCTSDTAILSIIINPLPAANFTSTGPYCVTKDVTFTDASVPNVGTIINWNWDLGDGTILNLNSPNPFTHQYAATGSYTVKLIVTTNKGCVSLVKTSVVNVQPLPVPSFTSSIECLPYGVASFSNTSTIANSTAMSYQWNFGDIASGVNNTSAVSNPSHYFSTTGPYTVTLTATSVDGCITTITQPVTNIYPQPSSAFFASAENCLNTATAFTSNANGNGSTITERHWDFGDGSFSTAQNPSHTYATAGIKTIKHWIVTDKGCYSDTTQHTVLINPLPTPNFNYNTPSCQTRVITFTDASTANAGNLNSWQWDFGDLTTGTGTPVMHTYINAGTYNVQLTVTTDKGCVSNPIASKAVAINPRPLAGFIIPEVCLSDTYAQFLDSSKVATGTVSNWQWDFGDINATIPNPNTSSLQNPTHSYTAVGAYNVQLISTSNIGCKDTITQVLFINGSFPAANFTVNNSTTLCANDSVAIVNASTVFPGTITKVEIYWDNVNFPAVLQTDDNPFSGKTYKHLYTNFQTPLTKTFTIRFRAYSGGVCVNDKLSTITINAAPKVQFNAMPNACLDAVPFQITEASEIGGVPGTFVYSGLGVSATGLFNPALAGVGTHLIKYTFTSTAGGCVDTMSRTIKVLDTATAKFSFAAPVCMGTPVNFKEESTAPTGVILNNSTWNFGDGTALEIHTPGSSFTHAFPAAGTYTVTMYNTSTYGCKSTSKVQQVTISPMPQTSFSFAQSSVCLPAASVSFVNNSTIADGTENAFTYLWNFGDPASGLLNTSVAKTPTPHIYVGTGPYSVILTVTSGSSCTKSFTKPVDFIHPQPKAAFDFNKPGVCVGEDVVFRDLTNGLDGTVVQWNWSFGDGIVGNTKQVQHLYTAANTYTVSLYIINSQGCNSDTLNQQFTVHPYPIVDAGPDRVVLQGGSITIQSNATGNDLQYLWSPTTYLNSTTAVNPVASDMQDDITYTLTVTARGGCKSLDAMFVKVLKAPRIPNTFTPNADGINDVWTIEYLDTYPSNRVQVFTRTGQLVFESRGYKTPWDGNFNGKPLPFDTYYYIVEPENGRKPITGYVTIVK